MTGLLVVNMSSGGWIRPCLPSGHVQDDNDAILVLNVPTALASSEASAGRDSQRATCTSACCSIDLNHGPEPTMP